ncbi:Tn3 family transposase [Photorhabdus asymbiotica]|uniref:Tn3 family transposase n=1 Tax=Photorhabdus asymbiotica TaxID=291112 RepID=UPI003DA6DE9C
MTGVNECSQQRGNLKDNGYINLIHYMRDTQGQSELVFALAYLLGIKLFPRMRNWSDVVFYRPSKEHFSDSASMQCNVSER